jgi:putative FmdB family regulatory protein
MPLYDYRCTACKSEFELLVLGSTVPTCPQCASAALERCVSLSSPQGKSAGLVAAGRARAAREGHFSHYSSSERPKK